METFESGDQHVSGDLENRFLKNSHVNSKNEYSDENGRFFVTSLNHVKSTCEAKNTPTQARKGTHVLDNSSWRYVKAL